LTRRPDETDVLVGGTSPDLVALYVRPLSPRRFGFESAMWTLTAYHPVNLHFIMGQEVENLQVQVLSDGKVSKPDQESERL
jgi:hypothetical protein